MSGNAQIWGRFSMRVALALACIVFAPAAFAADDKPAKGADDEPVGWPLRNEDKTRMERMERELRREQQATPLPERSEVTDQALAAWSGQEQSLPGGAIAQGAQGPPPLPPANVTVTNLPGGAGTLPAITGGAAVAAQIVSPEIAPLKRIIPPVRHELIVYAPGDFSISVSTAERLDQMAMRLRGTRDRISIVAHSSSGPGTGQGNAQISTHEAVKLSFKRAMLVRLYLIEEGVSPDQIDLEALPRSDDGGPQDRVEISATSKAARR